MTKLHEVPVTAIINKDGKYLIIRRSKTEKKFPGMWAVPGGRLEFSDYKDLPKDTNHHWFNVVEKTLRREIEEEVGLQVDNIDYLTSLAMMVGEYPSLILSFTADYKSGEVTLLEEELDKAEWVTLEEAKEYNLIEGIYDQLVMANDYEKRIKDDLKKNNI